MKSYNINLPRVVLSDTELLDYIHCPNLFYIKYMSHIPIADQVTMGSLVKLVINGYFSRLMDGKLPSISKAKNMWDKCCDEHPSVMTDKKVLEGFGLINLFDRYCYNNKIIIADFNSPYEVDFPGGVTVKGRFPAIRLNNNVLEFFCVEAGHAKPNQQLLDMSIKYTLQCYAMDKLSESHNLSCIRILHLKSGEEFTTYRHKKDYDRLERTVANIGKSIREEIFYPREDYTCPQCNAKNYCGHI